LCSCLCIVTSSQPTPRSEDMTSAKRLNRRLWQILQILRRLGLIEFIVAAVPTDSEVRLHFSYLPFISVSISWHRFCVFFCASLARAG
jgi:hypothetical protein